ncbi:PTS cellobiose transporter subunit IIC [Clostridium sp. JN-9]|uniref:PTS cellobiose transporter subunit IIC n=1 Tax=Clostridium sp. JN-9 TaxID=2507159 RepID=UPI000FFE2F0F|nr:PTS cellobiose transporter subunit IIC [Clostridium sp. JN-9]QAT41212.1 PTS cellobiose transporter subunit IIC [Clostridium sp. JN-9]
MGKKMDSIEEKVMPIADKFANNRFLLAIRDGFALAMPLLIIGAMSCLIANFPVKGFLDFMTSVFGPGWKTFFDIPNQVTMSLMSIFVVIGVSKSLAESYELDGINTAIISLVSFFILTPFTTDFIPKGAKAAIKVDGIIPLDWMGAKGLFVGMISAILATEIVRFVVKKGWVVKMPAGVPPTVSKAFSSLIPGAITIVLFDVIRLIFAFTPFGNIHKLIYTLLQVPLTSLGATFGANMIANFFVGFFWSFGIHGADIVQSVMNPIWIALSGENLAAFQAGKVVPHIITQQFNQIYLWIGGSGATLALCVTMMFFCKSQQCKKLGKLAILPGLFNINEPIIFGLPIVLNPIMLIPFILTPMILCIVCYAAMATGLVPKPNGVLIPWTTPVIIGGFFISGIRGAILQIVELIISFFTYLPFIKIVDKQYCDQEKSYETADTKDENAVLS